MIALAVLFTSMLALLFAGDTFQSGDDDALPNTDEDGRENERDLLGTSAGDRLDGAERSADVIYGYGGDDVLTGGDSFLQTAGYADTIYGGAGSDTISGGRGYDDLYGGAGHDVLSGDRGDDLLDGGAGEDTLMGDFRDDTLYGGDGDDYLLGGDVGSGAGFDALYGGGGNDLLVDRLGTFDVQERNPTTMFGGAGNDTLMFDDGGTYSGGVGADQFLGLLDVGADSAVQILDFDPAQDQLSLTLEVDGGDGNGLSLVPGGDGATRDLYFGTNLLARITSTAPFDLSDIETTLRLQAGDNGRLVFNDGTENSVMIVDAGANTATIDGGAGNDTISAGGAIFGNLSNDIGGENVIFGGSGNDFISASGGSYSYNSDAVVENIDLDAHLDTIDGGAGNDVLLMQNGGQMTGGEGADTFGIGYETLTQTGVPFDASTPIIITDFDPAQDRLLIEQPPNMPVLELSISVWSSGLGADVLGGTTVLASITGGQTLTLADISVVANLRDAVMA